MSAPVAIVGAGAFGTALATIVARNRTDTVALIGRDDRLIDEMRDTHENRRYLAGIRLPDNLRPTTDRTALGDAATVLFAVPSQAQRRTASALASTLDRNATVVVCAKGLEQATGKFLSDVLSEELPHGHAVAVLSGPGFAADIAAGLPTAMTVASADLAEAERLAALLSGANFRLYAADDVIGVEIGGALKNVLAIACGIVEGAKLGESARAALVARGLAELARFAVAHGARPETTAGLSGLGDLVLTATSRQSRNLRFGIALGEGRSPADLLGPDAALAEGAYTAAVAAARAEAQGIAMPVTSAISQIIEGRLTVADALKALMERPLKREGS